MYCLVRFSLTLLLVWDSWIVINNLARKFFRGTTRRCIQVFSWWLHLCSDSLCIHNIMTICNISSNFPVTNFYVS